MTGGGGGAGAADDRPFLLRCQQQSSSNNNNNNDNVGKYLLDLLQNQQQQQQQQQEYLKQTPLQFSINNNNNNNNTNNNLSSLDPAVAAVGPSLPIPLPSLFHYQNSNFPSQGFPPYPSWPLQHHQSPPHQTPSFFPAPHRLFRQQQNEQHQQQEPLKVLFGNVPFPSINNNNSPTITTALDQESFKKLELEQELGFPLRNRTVNGSDPNRRIDSPLNRVPPHGSPEQRWSGFGSGQPPGFSGKASIQRRSFSELNSVGSEFNNHRDFGLGSGGKDIERERRLLSSRGDNSDYNASGLSGQLDHPGLPPGSALHSVLKMDHHTPPQESLQNLDAENNEVGQDEIDELSEQLVDSVLAEDESDDKSETSSKKKHHRDKDFRSDARGKWILSQHMRNSRRLIECRRDIDRFNAPLIAIYESLIPLEEEKAKQKQLLTLLEKLVCKEWANAKLYVYGSCANSFGVSKSDIDICLAIDDQDINKSELLLKLADILELGNLQNVQALTHARVPIVKLMDPVTGISCDICINNVLAVVNTKLLRDYAKIDARLRQLAFLIKHWAKSRGVNETYQGTLSSYAYVLMCIHFLQQRNPPILPCLQGMKATYVVTVDDIVCAYFDQVERLHDFGVRNKESIAQLVWTFFNYWAYCHDYANSVISIRTGSILSKHDKDWTRRIGNDRHLICIEDPFETSHDLGRVVDKRSIRVLREEFERAAEIMQFDPNPWVALFEPYIPS